MSFTAEQARSISDKKRLHRALQPVYVEVRMAAMAGDTSIEWPKLDKSSVNTLENEGYTVVETTDGHTIFW